MQTPPTEVSSVAAPASDPTRTRLRINLGLFILVAFSFTFWFQRHMEHLVTESLVIGGTMTLWGVWQVFMSWLNWGADEELKSLPARLLNNVNSTKFLLFCLLLSFAFHLLTSSIHVEYAPVPGSPPEYTVAVLHRTNGQPYLPPLQVSSASRVAGRPYFFRLRSDPLVLRIEDPRGFADQEKLFRPGSRVRMTVPTDFKTKKFHLLRVVPSPKLLNLLAEPGGPQISRYELRVNWGTCSNVIHDLRKQTLYLGAELADLKYVLGRENVADRYSEFNRHLAGISMDPRDRDHHLRLYETNCLFLSTPEILPSEPVHVVLWLPGENRLLFETNINLEVNHAIRTLFLHASK